MNRVVAKVMYELGHRTCRMMDINQRGHARRTKDSRAEQSRADRKQAVHSTINA